MMYYIYIRKINSKRYIGFAVAINGYYFVQINPLFQLFEKKIEQLAEHGVIIYYSKNGDLTTSLSNLIKEEEEVLNFANILQARISAIESIKRLPQIDYGVSIKSQKIFNENDNNSEIVKASYTYGYTVILKQENYDTLRSTSYRNTLKQLNAQNELLNKEVEKLKETNRQILRKKRQFKKVIFLFFAVIACSIGIYFLHKDLSSTQNELNSANNTIQNKNSVIKDKNERISNLRDSVLTLERNLEQVRHEKADLSDKIHEICNAYPFIVTSCNVNSKRFMFDYYCPKEKKITVTLKAVNAKSSEIITNSHTLTFYKGGGTKNLDFGRKLNNRSYYYIVLLYKGQIIAGTYW